jgi:hypothetical protein
MNNALEVFLGIGVSKARLDCSLLSADRHRSKGLRDDEAGLAELQGWLECNGVDQVYVCMEARHLLGTGRRAHE